MKTAKDITPHKFVGGSEMGEKLEKLYFEGLSGGRPTGFVELDKIITLKLGTTFYVYGQPGSGKTELWLEILVNTAERYGWKHVLYTPEGGEPFDIIGELISKRYGKPFYKNIPGAITENEMHTGRAWVDEYFRIIDPEDRDVTVESFFSTVDFIEESGFSVNTTLIDPWNELKHDFSEAGGHRDVYLEDKLGVVRRNAMKYNRLNAVVTHIADQKLIEKDGKRFYPPPTARELAGGQAWHRKGMNMLSVWRPPPNMLSDDGIPYKDNEAHVTCHKYKPKGIGKRGTAILFYDWKKNKYYEAGGLYADRDPIKKVHQVIQPNLSFYETERAEDQF